MDRKAFAGNPQAKNEVVPAEQLDNSAKRLYNRTSRI